MSSGTADSAEFPVPARETESVRGVTGRSKLNREAVVTEALRLVREEGIDAVTMRRLATELDTSAMSLYRHVADRQDLLIAMLDVVAPECTSRPWPATDVQRSPPSSVLFMRPCARTQRTLDGLIPRLHGWADG